MVTKAKFSPIGEELSYATAFSQAAMALDVAGRIAERKEDITGLYNVAALYIELGARLMPPLSDEEIDGQEVEAKNNLGFRPEQPAVVPVKEIEDE